MATTTTTILNFNPFANIGEQIEYGVLANSCGFGQEEGKSSFACILSSYISQQQEIERLKRRVEELEHKDEEEEEGEITEEQVVAEFNKIADKHGLSPAQRECGIANTKAVFNSLPDTFDPQQLTDQLAANTVRLVRENAELKGQVQHLRKENEELKAHRPKHTCPQDEDLTGGDANYKYYFAHNEDGEMTIWKVPRHLDEVKSANPDTWDNAVQECFRNGKFGEEWDTLNYLIVREMKLKDLVKRKWTPKAEPQE